jgi:hypothetical protein
MNAEAILNKIEEDARQTAEQTLADAKAKAEGMKTASREKIEGMHKTMLSQAEKDGEALTQRLLRMAELDDRKELLGKKRALMDEAFALAGQKMLAAPDADKRAFFLRQIVKLAAGSETLAVGADGAGWFDEGFTAQANAALASAGKPGNLTLDPQMRAGCAGVILTANGAETRCTFDALLDEARSALEQQAAAGVFDEP